MSDPALTFWVALLILELRQAPRVDDACILAEHRLGMVQGVLIVGPNLIGGRSDVHGHSLNDLQILVRLLAPCHMPNRRSTL